MCGRDYSTYTEDELYFRYLNRKTWPWPIAEKIPEFKPNYNMCPTQQALVLSVYEGALGFRTMRWGLVPAWAKTVKDADKYSMINAKAEEIAQKRSYMAAFKKRRCIIPVSGFYEWQKSGEKKKPFAIHEANKSIMSLAGIWEQWVSKENGEIVDSFSIVTTSANSFMSQIHTRMPVILGEADEKIWLDSEITAPDQLTAIMANQNSVTLMAYEISTLVNSPRNNVPAVLNSAAETPSPPEMI